MNEYDDDDDDDDDDDTSWQAISTTDSYIS